MSDKHDEDGGDRRSDEEKGKDGEYKVMYKGKGMTEEEYEETKKAEKIAEEIKLKNKKRNERRNRNRFKTSVNRHDPYSAERKLIQMTQSARSRPSSGESAGTSGQSTSSEEPGRAAVPLGTQTPGASTSDPTLTLLITRADNYILDREDIFFIHAEIASAEIRIVETVGDNPHNITCAKRDTPRRGYTLTCNTQAALAFYKGALENCTDLPDRHQGYKCYLPGEKPPGHQIMGKLYLSHWKNKEKLHIAFAAGSAGAVKPNQVFQYRPAKRSTDNSMIQVYLELDDSAFEWLRSRNWNSRIGGSEVPWRAPNIQGLQGIFRPDEDVYAIKQAMIASLNNIHPETLTENKSSENNLDPITDGIKELEVISQMSTPNTDEVERVYIDDHSETDNIAWVYPAANTITDTETDLDETLKADLPKTPPPETAATMKTPVSSPELNVPPNKITRTRTMSYVSEHETEDTIAMETTQDTDEI